MGTVVRALPVPVAVVRADVPHLTVVAASPAFVQGAERRAEGGRVIIGRPLLDAFPAAPPRAADGTALVADVVEPSEAARQACAAIERVAAAGVPEELPLTRYPLQRADGAWEERWWQVVLQPVVGDTNRVDYVALVVTEATARVRAERTDVVAPCVAEAVERVGEAVVVLDADGRIMFANARAATVLPEGPRPLAGLHWLAAAPALAATELVERARRVRTSGAPDRFVTRLPGGSASFEVHLHPAPDGLVVLLEDVSRRVRLEQELALLEETGSILSMPGDVEPLLQQVGRRLVPHLGDFCAIDIIPETSEAQQAKRARRVVSVHVDVQKERVLQRYAERYAPGERNRASPAAVAITTERPVLLPVVPRALIEATPDAGHRALVEALGPRSMIAVPLRGQHTILGALTVGITESGRRYDAEDLALVGELALRIAGTLERGRLYASERRARIAADSARLRAEERAAELARALEQAGVAARAAAAARDEATMLSRSLDEVNREFVRATAEHTEGDRARMDFLAVMSHELRTPLHAIGGYTELLDLGIFGTLTDEARAQLARIRFNQQHLLRIIEGMLAFARLEAGDRPVARQHIALGAVIRDEVEPLVCPQAEAKGVRLALDTNACLEDAIVDRDKFRQIVVNLVDNGIKFTAPGGEVRLRCASTDDGIEIVVTDTGVGIPPAQHEAIFNPFRDRNRILTRTAGGAGLGLPIARAYARQMGGDLTVASVPERGSTFTVRLPRAGTRARSAPATAVAERSTAP